MLKPMTAKEARAKNLALLIKTKAAGKQRLFAETYGFDASHISQMINGLTMGDSVARKIEQLFGMERGAMDRPPATLADAIAVAPEKEVVLTPEEDIEIRRELLDYWKHLPGGTKKRLLADAKHAIAASLQEADRETAALRKRLGMTGNATDRRVAETIGHVPSKDRRKHKLDGS